MNQKKWLLFASDNNLCLHVQVQKKMISKDFWSGIHKTPMWMVPWIKQMQALHNDRLAFKNDLRSEI